MGTNFERVESGLSEPFKKEIPVELGLGSHSDVASVTEGARILRIEPDRLHAAAVEVAAVQSGCGRRVLGAAPLTGPFVPRADKQAKQPIRCRYLQPEHETPLSFHRGFKGPHGNLYAGRKYTPSFQKPLSISDRVE